MSESWSCDQGDLEFVDDPALYLEEGGNAHLRPCRFRGDAYLFKEFHAGHLADVSVPALTNLVGWRRQLPAAERYRLDAFAAWPHWLVLYSGQLRGVLVPLAPELFYQPRRDGGRTPRSFYDLIAVRSRAGAALPQRLRTFYRAVDAVLWLHERGVIVNDLQPANVLCDDAGQAVWFVDCDSMVSGSHWGIVAPVAAPESMKDVVPDADDPTAATDLAKLAWVLMRILLDDFGVTGLGPAQRQHVVAAIGPSAAAVLFAAATQRQPAPEDWRAIAGEWRELTVRIPTSRPASGSPDPAPRRPGQRQHRTGGWLPAGFAYEPGPPPPVFPPGHGASAGRRRLPTAGRLLVAAAVGLVLLVALAAGSELLSGRN